MFGLLKQFLKQFLKPKTNYCLHNAQTLLRSTGFFEGAVLVSNEWNLRLEESVKFYGGDWGGDGLGGETQFPELTLAHTALKSAHVHPCDRAKQQGSSSSARDKLEQESILFLSR